MNIYIIKTANGGEIPIISEEKPKVIKTEIDDVPKTPFEMNLFMAGGGRVNRANLKIVPLQTCQTEREKYLLAKIKATYPGQENELWSKGIIDETILAPTWLLQAGESPYIQEVLRLFITCQPEKIFSKKDIKDFLYTDE